MNATLEQLRADELRLEADIAKGKAQITSFTNAVTQLALKLNECKKAIAQASLVKHQVEL